MNSGQNNDLPQSLHLLAMRYERMTICTLHGSYLLSQVIATTHTNSEITGSVKALETYLGEHKLSTANYFSGLFLIHAVSEVENYMVDALRAVIAQFPKKLGAIEFKLSEILEKGQDELVLMAADSLLNKLAYARPLEFLKEFCSLVSIDPKSIEPHWPAFIEAKARRDLGIHNNWRMNDTYRRKVKESGVDTALIPKANADGFLFADFSYVSDTVANCDKLVRGIRDNLLKTFPKAAF